MVSLVVLMVLLGSVVARNSNDVASAMRILKFASDVADKGSQRQREIPFTTISFAQTIDGSIAPTTRGRIDISSKTSFQILHSLRAKSDAVLVGVNTLLLDNPQLNARDILPGIEKPKDQPRSVVLDSTLRFCRGGARTALRVQRPIVFTCVPEDDVRFHQANEMLAECGGTVVAVCETEDGRCDIADCMRVLRARFNVHHLLVEGGARVLQDVLERGMAHQALITLQPCFLGGYRSLTRQLVRPVALEDIAVASVGGDIVIHGIVQNEAHGSGEAIIGGKGSSLSFRRAKNINLI